MPILSPTLRLALPLVCTAALCACRGLPQTGAPAAPQDSAAAGAPDLSPARTQLPAPLPSPAPVVSPDDFAPSRSAAVPQAESAIQPAAHYDGAGYAALPQNVSGGLGGACPTCGPLGYTGPWRPPGIPGPWPADEYICDGGDLAPEVVVHADWSVHGLHIEDTVAHYDTLDGRTEVQQSNRCCLYAPRFAAVRKTYGLSVARGRRKGTSVEQPTGPEGRGGVLIPDGVLSQLQPRGQLGREATVTFKDRNQGLRLDGRKIPAGIHNDFAPYEDFQIIKRGQFDASEKARLAESIEAALAWTSEQAVQVTVNGRQVQIQQSTQRAQQTELYERPPGLPRVRIVKVASCKNALPGETIEFTLRFDNIGDQPIGNVTVLDNLSPRLEYVEGSQQCDPPADFLPEENEAGSLVLRWEIHDPLEISEGGIIRFRCRVR